MLGDEDSQLEPSPSAVSSASGLQPPAQLPPMPPPAPQPLLPNQCAMGAESSEPRGATGMYADPEKLYLDVNRPAQCSGVIVRWEVCFGMEGASPVPENKHLRLVVFRPENGGRYKVGPQTTLDLAPDADFEAAAVTCRYIDIDAAEDAISVSEGDVIGFVSSPRIRLALSTAESSTLYVYEHRPTSPRRRATVGNAIGGEAILQSDLELVGSTVAPLLRVVISELILNY